MENLTEPLSQQTKIQLKEPKKKKKKNYSFLEILIVISAIAVVGVLALLAINPEKQDADSRNTQRRADTSSILSQVTKYVHVNTEIPEEIPIGEQCVAFGNEICKMGPYDCSEYVDLSFLNDPSSEEIVKIPTDPQYLSTEGTGYYIVQDGSGGLTVCAPYAERGEDISFTKYLY